MATKVLSRIFVIVVFWPACTLSVLPAQTATADYFDPAQDPIAQLTGVRTQWLVPTELLDRALHARLHDAGRVENIEILPQETRFFLLFSCRSATDMEQSELYVVPLRSDSANRLLAEPSYDACIGKTCSICGWDPLRETCFCTFDKPGVPGEPGHCNHIFSSEMPLGRVKRRR